MLLNILCSIMNRPLIEKVIVSNNESCPEFIYENPLLDKNVARALSKSFIRIFEVSRQNSNLHVAVLENIRKMCRIEPENHVKIDERLTELLSEFYQKHIRETTGTCRDPVDNLLNSFLMTRIKESDTRSSLQSSLNPEIVRAFINLNETEAYIDSLSKDIMYWDVTNNKSLNILKDLWINNNDILSKDSSILDNVSIKMKPEIELMLLNICNDILVNRDIVVQNIFHSNSALETLLKACSISPNCFQMCCSILNFLFIITDFNLQINTFIFTFVNKVKLRCTHVTFSILYPIGLSSLVLLLDIEIDEMPPQIKEGYLQSTVNYLQILLKDSKNDLILLLSHFPQWFDVYFELRN